MGEHKELKEHLKLIAITSIVLLILDSIFLAIINEHFHKQIFDVQRENLQINIFGVIICYIFLIIGLYYFIIYRRESLFNAFLLGIVIYGVYEYTSYALLKKWKLQTTIIDTIWGGLLFALTTGLVYKIQEISK